MHMNVCFIAYLFYNCNEESRFWFDLLPQNLFTLVVDDLSRMPIWGWEFGIQVRCAVECEEVRVSYIQFSKAAMFLHTDRVQGLKICSIVSSCYIYV